MQGDKVRFRQGTSARVAEAAQEAGQLLFATYEDETLGSSVRQGNIYFDYLDPDTTNITRVRMSNDVDRARSLFAGVTKSSDTPGQWTADIDGVTALYDGLTIVVQLNTSYNSTYNTLNVNNLGPKLVWFRRNSRLTSHIPSGSEMLLVYRASAGSYTIPTANPGCLEAGVAYSDGWVLLTTYPNTNTYTSALSTSTAATKAKTATCSNYSLAANSYIHVIFNTGNTYKGTITLNINGKGAKNVYINDAISSASNYTLPAGSYIAYYNGTNYYFRTDGLLPGAGIIGNATTATAADHLATAGTLITNLGSASTDPVTYTNGGNISINVTGILPTSKGGTGYGKATLTKNRIIYSGSTTQMKEATNLYTSGSDLAVNASSINSGYKFEVYGQSGFDDIILRSNKSATIGDYITIGGLNDAAKTLTSSSTLYLKRGNNETISFQFGNNTINANFDSNGHFLPGANITYNIGSNDYRWNQLYIKQGDISDTLAVHGATALNSSLTVVGNTTLNNTLTTRDIIPYQDRTYKLGASDKYWKDAYIFDIHSNDYMSNEFHKENAYVNQYYYAPEAGGYTNFAKYEELVILLLPYPTSSTATIKNYVNGEFTFYGNTTNILNSARIEASLCGTNLRYSLNYTKGSDESLVTLIPITCVYNNIRYFALQCRTQSSPWFYAHFHGHIYSALAGGNVTTNSPLKLPAFINYKRTPNGSLPELIRNAEVNDSISTTLTTGTISTINSLDLYHSSKLIITDETEINNNASALQVAGGAIISKKLQVGGATSLQGALNVAGATLLSSTLSVTGNTTISGTFTGNSTGQFKNILTLYRQSTTTQNYASGIRFQNKDTTTSVTGEGYIYFYNCHGSSNDNNALVINSKGSIFVGGGEGPEQLYTTIKPANNENFYIITNATNYIESGDGNSVDRAGIALDATSIYPVKAEVKTNNTISLGTNDGRFNKIYGTNLSVTNLRGLDDNTFYMVDANNNQTVSFITTKNSMAIAPYADLQGSLGDPAHRWGSLYVGSFGADFTLSTGGSYPTSWTTIVDSTVAGYNIITTGTYIIQVIISGHYYSGICSWVADNITNSDADIYSEIPLHYMSKNAPAQVHLRTLVANGSANPVIQMKIIHTNSSGGDLTIRMKKII